ncbi:hypothetical protein CEK65_01415 [Xanthomonas sp. LMG 12459]|nr:hypothetical protein CEK65_01415 [Xanthomonas sp. LMG 12459]
MLATQMRSEICGLRKRRLGPAVLGQVGEGHVVVGQHGLHLLGEDLGHGLEEGRTSVFPAQSWNSI